MGRLTPLFMGQLFHQQVHSRLCGIRMEESHRHKEQTCDCQGEGGMGKGWIGSLGLADAII